MARKILLANIATDAVTRTLRWRGWNNSDKAANITLTQGTMVEAAFFAQAAIAAGSSGGVRSIATITERTYIEVTVVSKTSNPISIGVSRSDIAIATVPGNSPSIAVYRSDGNFRNNSANTAGPATWTTGDVISVFVDPITSPGNLLIWWQKNNAGVTTGVDTYSSATYTLATAAGTNWHFYVGGETAAATLDVNMGQAPFKYRGRGYFRGIQYADLAGAGAWRFSNDSFITAAADSPAHTPYDPRIVAVPEFSKEIGSFIWGNSGATTSIGYLDLNNADGGLDAMRAYDFRDALLTLYSVEEGSAFSTATVVARAVVDRLDVQNSSILRLVLRDKSSILAKPTLSEQYSETVPNTSLKGQLRPLVVGAANSVEPIQYDQANLIYDLTSKYRISATGFRDQGLTVTTFTVAGKVDCNGVTRTTAPAGVQTSSCTAIRLTTQKLGNAQNGNFATWAGDNPSTWTTTDPNTAVNKITQVATGARFLADGTLGAGALQITQNVFSAGVDRPYFEVNVVSWTSGQLEVTQSGTVIGTITGPGIWRFTLNFASLAADFTLRVKATTATDMIVSYAYGWAYVTTADFAGAVDYVMQTLAGLTTSDYSQSDVTALVASLVNDAASVSAGANVGYYVAQQINLDAVLNEIMDAVAGFWYVDLTGVIRFGSIDLALSTTTAALTIEEDDIVEDSLSIEFDEMTGAADTFLGNRNERPLTDGEFAGAVSAADRQLLKAPYQVRRAPGATDALPLAKSYAFVKGKEQPIRLTSDGIAFKGMPYRIREFCCTPRYFYRFRCTLTTASLLTLKLSDFVTLKSSRYGFPVAGKKLIIKRIAGRFDSNIVEIVAWG